MRLLFTYFYNEIGTFKENTIISFCKKYTIYHDKNKRFYFKLTKNKNYDSEFYLNNSDIGVIIGENGTGKSILINNLRDSHNQYSIIVYEKDDGNLFYFGQKTKVFINESEIIQDRNFDYIYYSSIFEIYENEINKKYNISNVALHLDLEKDIDFDEKQMCITACTKIRLNSIENEDLKKYFNYKKIKDEKVKVNYLKLQPNINLFEKFEQEVLKYNEEIFDNVFNIEASKSNLNIEYFENIIKNIKNPKIVKLVNMSLREGSYLYHEIVHNNKLSILLSKDYNICRQYLIYLDRYLIKQQIITKDIYQFEQFIKNSINNRFYEIFDTNIFLEKTINNTLNIDKILNSSETLFNFFFELIETEIYHNLNTLSSYNTDDYFMEYWHTIDENEQQKIFHYLEGNKKFSQFVRYVYINHIIDDLESKILAIIAENFKEEKLRTFVGKRDFNNIHKKLKEQINHGILLIKIKVFYQEFHIDKLAFKKSGYFDILINLIKYNLFDDFDSLFENISLNEKNIEKLYKNYLVELINLKDINNELKKILFIIYFKNVYDKLDSELARLDVMLTLSKICILDSDDSKYSQYLKKYNNFNLSYMNRLFILDDYDKYLNHNRISETQIIRVDDVFFKYSKIFIDKDINAFKYNIYPALSSGQKAILFIFSRIDDAIKKINSENPNPNILILLDEADLKLHLEWQRKFVNDLIEFLNSYSDYKFYILYATHSPMILSDITDDRVVFLKNEDGYSTDVSQSKGNKKRTFGANIYDLYHDSFFMDQFMGEFAQNKINEIIDIINLYKIIVEFEKRQQNSKKIMKYIKPFINKYDLNKIINSYNNRYIKKETIDIKTIRKIYKDKIYLEDIKHNISQNEERDKLQATIESIGEPILRNQLLDEVKNIGVTDKTDEIVDKLKDSSHDVIEKELLQYDREKQIEIWKKLFKIKDSK